VADLLSIGKTGLFASKQSLETTAHNLANVNTEGYSRQRVELQTGTPVTKGGLITGTGVRISDIKRINDPFIEKKLQANTSQAHYLKDRSELLDQVENVFNENNGEGLNSIINKFFNSFKELSGQPENETIRSMVRDNALMVTNDFQRIRTSLDDTAKNIDKKLEQKVGDVNFHIKKIAELNRKINELEASNGESGDLRDQRDLTVRVLSESVKIVTYTDDKNNYIVSADGVGTLVSGTEVQEFGLISRSKEDSTNNMAASREIVFKSRSAVPITSKFRGGEIASLISVRNKDILQSQKEIDSIAYNFAKIVNAIHSRGHVNRNIPTDSARNPASFDQVGPTTGINFFELPENIEDAAHNITLSSEIRSDLSNICTALNPNAPGDNRIALAISKIQHEKMLGEGTTTLEEEYLKTVGRVGLDSAKSKLDSEQAAGILTQTKSIRERTSGVSIDEEAAAMIKFQHAYEASAKIMRAADEMFKTVIGIKS
jgi:flagellar hook-associated protein 1 FlgK